MVLVHIISLLSTTASYVLKDIFKLGKKIIFRFLNFFSLNFEMMKWIAKK